MDRPKTHREETFSDAGNSKFLWCLHCERAYKNGEFRLEEGLQMCPYVDCSGDTVIDAWKWDSLVQNHPEYPKVPVYGEVYPLYSK